MKHCTIPQSLRDATNKDLEIPKTCRFFHPNFFEKNSLHPMLYKIIVQSTFLENIINFKTKLIPMGVQKDAGELLLYFYNELITNGKNLVETQNVVNETKWTGSRINNAYNYLYDFGLLKGERALGNIDGAQIFCVMRLFPEGINIVENKPEFKKNFGFEVNLGLIKFSWGATEK